jgi:catechol 2,3-dioxygenase-like lactoylglutathione lyase family enzyme
MSARNEQFDLKGVNHVALVCRDMERTVAFYSGVLGMPLVKTIELPFGGGQHFFFDIGNGDCLAFFWFPDAPIAAPGVASAGGMPGAPEWTSAIGSMNHLAFNVDTERFDEYVEHLRESGVECSGILNHDDSELGFTKRPYDGTFVRSVYFFDPDGILLEFAAWTRPLTESDVRHAPARAQAETAARD